MNEYDSILAAGAQRSAAHEPGVEPLEHLGVQLRQLGLGEVGVM